MLTIIAWVVFVPALAMNILFLLCLGAELLKPREQKIPISIEDIRFLVMFFVLMIVPGVYLFGIF